MLQFDDEDLTKTEDWLRERCSKLRPRARTAWGLLVVWALLVMAGFAAATGPPQRPGRLNRPPPTAGAVIHSIQAPGERSFDFEKRATPVDEALSILLGRERSVPLTADDASKYMAERARARATLRLSPKLVAATVISELEKLSKDDVENHAMLFSLLDTVADEDEPVAYWSKKLMSGVPRQAPRFPVAKKSNERDRPNLGRRLENDDPEALIRYLAIAHLYRAALRGNERAKAAILDSVKSPHYDVKITAIQYTYALNRHRWKARHELEKRLAPSDHYLLYRY